MGEGVGDSERSRSEVLLLDTCEKEKSQATGGDQEVEEVGPIEESREEGKGRTCRP